MKRNTGRSSQPARRWCTYAVAALFIGSLIAWARFYTALVDLAAAHGFPGWQHYVWPVILLGPVAVVLLVVSRRCSR